MNTVPVLLYHSISDRSSSALADYTLSPPMFAEHAAVIVDQGWQVVTITELTRRIVDGRLGQTRTLAITFDDGFADNAEEAAGILSGHGLAATLYVASGTVGMNCNWLGGGGRRPMASWQQLRDLAATGWEIGAHSITHPELDVVPAQRAVQEITLSRTALQEGLGVGVDSFAYPHGYHSNRVREAVIAAGFTSACAVKNSFSHDGDDRFARARLTIPSTLTGDDLAKLLEQVDQPQPRPTVRAHMAKRAWRSYRRARWLAGRSLR